jgi:hypothetical protein
MISLRQNKISISNYRTGSDFLKKTSPSQEKQGDKKYQKRNLLMVGSL